MRFLLAATTCFMGTAMASTHRRLRAREAAHPSSLQARKHIGMDELEDDFMDMLRFLQALDMSMTSAPTTSPIPAPTTPPVRMSIEPTDEPTFSPTPRSENRVAVINEKCGVTPLERSRDILSILSLISEPTNLVDPFSPQFQARDFVDNVDDAILCADDVDRIGQRFRLALLYYSLGGPDWANCRSEDDATFNDYCLEEDLRSARSLARLQKEGKQSEIIEPRHRNNARYLQAQAETVAVRWLDGSNECNWFGVDCGEDFDNESDGDKFVAIKTIDLSNNNLQGTLFPEIFGFKALEGLFLDGNMKISGTIPPEISNLSALNFLDLDNNSIGGSLPESLFTLTNLMSLDLMFNEFTGTLSSSISTLQKLEVLQLENNVFQGELPEESLLDIQRLVALSIQGNLLTGSLEPLCEVRDERRKEYEIYLEYVSAECGPTRPLVECSCCECPA